MAHTFDTSAQGVGSANPLLLSYTCGAGATVLVIGLVVKSLTARAGGNPTYNNIAMTQASTRQQAATEVAAEIWYLLNPPTGSAYNISVPNTGGLTIRIIASSYKAASGKQSALDVANGWTGTIANPSNSVTTNVNGDAVVDILAHALNTPETGRNQTLLYATDEGVWNSAAEYALQATAGSITFSHTIAADSWGQIIASFKETQVYIETLVSIAVSITSISALQTFINLLLSTITSLAGATEIQTYKEAPQTTAVSQATLNDIQTYLQTLQTLIQSQAGAVDGQAYKETILSTGISSASVIDAIMYLETLQSVAQSVSTIQALQNYIESISTLIQSGASVSDAAQFIENIITTIQSSASVDEQEQGSISETLLTVITSVASVDEAKVFIETVNTIIQSVASITEVMSFLESVSSIINSISAVSDKQLFVENISIMASSGTSLSEIMNYIESIITVGITQATVEEFFGRYIIGMTARARLFYNAVPAREFNTIVRYRSFEAAA